MSKNTSTQMCVVAAQVINHHVPLDAVRGIEEDVLGRGFRKTVATLIDDEAYLRGSAPTT
jgi:hypothetical protein